MAKNLEITVLYDFYGDLLTEKQQEVIELYYQEDLSLAEIASFSGISRQGVRDSIKRAEGQLTEFEDRLGLARRFSEIRESLAQIADNVKMIEQLNQRLCGSREITRRVADIVRLANGIEQI